MKKCKKCGEVMEDAISVCEKCLCSEFDIVKKEDKKIEDKKVRGN